MEAGLLLAVLSGMLLLLWMILVLRLPAFIALLMAAIITGLLAGMEPARLMEAVKTGMGGTLGFVATVVGLGTIFGGVLQHTGSAAVLANRLLSAMGEQRAPAALLITGFIVSIPIFFDVGIVILFPVIAALSAGTGKHMVHFALPLLAGLAVSHAFIPPTPGPLAVADMLGIPLGWMVVAGIIAGLPAAYVAGIWYGRYVGPTMPKVAYESNRPEETPQNDPPGFWLVFLIIILPIFLIVGSTVLEALPADVKGHSFYGVLVTITHPFSALLLANLLAWYVLGRKSGLSTAVLSDISAKSLQPAGVIILVTGAGGVFKQILIDTGAGKMMADGMQHAGLSIVLFSFLSAAIVRVLQGSATVAMITAAGLVAPLLPSYALNDGQLAALGVSIASGATVLSHLNDSGFWMVKEYFGLTEREGMRVWTVASTLLGVTGAIMSALIFFIAGL